MEIRSHHWLLALSAASLVHAALIVGLNQQARALAPVAETPIVIELGGMSMPQGDSDGDASGAEPPAAEMVQALAVSDVLAPIVSSDLVEVQEVEPPRPVVTRTPARPQRAKPQPEPKVRQKPKPVSKPASRTAKADVARPRATSRSPTGTGARQSKGAARGARAGGGSGAGSKRGANYHGRLAAWLNRHKRYPSRARRLRQEGTVRVTFTIDRNGRLLAHRIVGRSGHPLLDQAAQALIKRASPMPAFPPTMSQSRLTLTVPISFNLR